MAQSKELSDFYRDYLNAVESHQLGLEVPEWFNPNSGLCGNLRNYFWGDFLLLEGMEVEMENQFVEDDLPKKFPFGRDDFFDYHDKTEDPKRIEWVKSKLL